MHEQFRRRVSGHAWFSLHGLRICVFISLRIFASHCCHQPYQSISCARCASSLLKMMLPLILSRNIDTSHTHSGLIARHHRIRTRTSPSAVVLYLRVAHNRLAYSGAGLSSKCRARHGCKLLFVLCACLYPSVARRSYDKNRD